MLIFCQSFVAWEWMSIRIPILAGLHIVHYRLDNGTPRLDTKKVTHTVTGITDKTYNCSNSFASFGARNRVLSCKFTTSARFWAEGMQACKHAKNFVSNLRLDPMTVDCCSSTDVYVCMVRFKHHVISSTRFEVGPVRGRPLEDCGGFKIELQSSCRWCKWQRAEYGANRFQICV